MGEPEITAFLTYLAVQRNVAASTQNQALSAILFLYKQVLKQDLDWLDSIVRAKRPSRLPTVLTAQETQALLSHLKGTNKLIAELLYGTGMRLMECLRLRVKDVDFEYRQITVRGGKGDKDRVTVLPVRTIPELRSQMEHTKRLHALDLGEGFGEVYLPFALARKYPNAGREWLAVRVRVQITLRGSTVGRYTPAPLLRKDRPARLETGGAGHGSHEAGEQPGQ